MRILLFTGKGGVGKTTVAAATAARAAEFGLRTIVCSTDPAHSLADAFDVPLGDRPTPIAHGLFGQQLNARVRFEEAWDDVRTYLVDVLDWAGADAVEAEELAVIPGLDEVFALGDIKEFATNGEYDLVVVDCAPTAETIRLLSLPDVLGWYMDRMFDTQRRLTRLARPILQRVSGVPIAGDGVFGAIRRFYERLDGVRELLTDGDITSARLVVNPERLVVAEARRTFTYLSLFGYHVDAVIANRILPAELDHPWMTQWRATQSAHLDVIAETFAPLPVLEAELANEEVVGMPALSIFAKHLYGDTDVAARLSHTEPFTVDAEGDALLLSVQLPFTDQSEVRLGRTGDELVLTVGPHRRALMLPDSLVRRDVAGARFVDDRLVVEFV
ncbi:MAG: arsenite/tail-anchored protein-transporting ATPase [Actinomycetota bacterium]|jgi:arsenite-transporting ATPase|nr:arsenite/tail-anchored protein-transporting ATPase [Actinomycetota bacterium]